MGKTLVNRTTGLKNANDALKGRIFEVSLADLQKDEDHAFRKIKLRVDEVQGKNCLTNFHGLDFTSDKLRSLVRKWHSLIEAHADELVKAESQNTGKPIALTLSEEIPPMADQIRFFAGAARMLEGRSAGEYMSGFTSFIRREPIGVCAAVITSPQGPMR